MKPIFFTIGLLLFAFALPAQVTLRGIVTYQNSGKKMDALQVLARGASPTITRAKSNTEGIFVLTFPDSKVGDVVYLELLTPIYDLVNDPRELEIVLTDKADYKVRLVVCKKGERDANAIAYYKISTKYLEASYQKQIKKKETDIIDLQKQLTQSGANTVILNQEIYKLQSERAKLDEQLEAQKKNAYKLAEDFSRIDLAQADSIYRQAFEAFKDGDIDGARQILNSKEAKQQELDLNNLYTAIQMSKLQVQKMKDSIKAAEKRIANAEVQRDSLKATIIKKKMLDGKLAELQFKFDEAERLYSEGVRLDEKDMDNLWTLAYFLAKQNENLKAITYYEKALALAKTQSSIGTLCNNLGSVYISVNRVSEAKKYYLQSLVIFERFAKSNPQQFEFKLAETAINLGNYYQIMNKMPEAKKYYLQSLAIFERLAKSSPQQFEPNLAATAVNLGNYYRDVNKMMEAEKYYLQALEIYGRLAKRDPQQFEPYLAVTAINFGNYYSDVNKMMEAEKYYLQAFAIYERLTKSNAQQFEHYLAGTAVNLGIFYNDVNKMVEAEKHYLRAIDIYDRLIKSNPQQFEPSLAKTAKNLGDYYKTLERIPEVEKYYLQAFAIYERLTKSNPKQFELELAATTMNLGSHYQNINKMLEAEKYFLQSLNIRERLAKINPQRFEPHLATVTTNLGIYYAIVKRMSEAEKYFLQSLGIRKRLAKSNPQQFESELAKTTMNLGNYYQINNERRKAEKYYLQSLAIYERLAQINPQKFESDLASNLNNYGVFNFNDKQYDKAKNALSRALALQQKALINGFKHYESDYNRVFMNLRELRDTFDAQNNYAKVVDIQTELAQSKELLREVSAKGDSIASVEFGSLSWYQLFTKEYNASEASARRALELDNTQTWIKAKLAHALLFQNKDAAAKAEYNAFKTQKNVTDKSYYHILNKDFDTLEKAGLDKKLLDKARKWIVE